MTIGTIRRRLDNFRKRNFDQTRPYYVEQGSICETRAGPKRPQIRRGMVFVDFKYIFYENRYFWPIWQLPVGCFWPKWSKGTSTDQDLSFEPITKHPNSIGPQLFGWGLIKRDHETPHDTADLIIPNYYWFSLKVETLVHKCNYLKQNGCTPLYSFDVIDWTFNIRGPCRRGVF